MVVSEAFVEELLLLLLVLTRVSGLILATPFFGGSGVPTLMKMGLASLIAILLYPVLPPSPVPVDLLAYLVAVAQELAVGVGMGFMVTAAFSAIHVAGQLMDVPMGFGMVNVLDPTTGDQIPILAQFQYVLAILIFFTINAHHTLFRALADSYVWIPVGAMGMTGTVVETAIHGIASMFVLGLRIGLPVMAAAFLTDVALGIVARAVPQINVFMTGFPLKIVAGLAVLTLILPVYVAVVSAAFGDNGEMMRLLWRFLRSV